MQHNHEFWCIFMKFNGQQNFKYGNDKFLAWVTWYDHIWKDPQPAEEGFESRQENYVDISITRIAL